MPFEPAKDAAPRAEITSCVATPMVVPTGMIAALNDPEPPLM
ncbi:hypothetical protein AB0912_03005 [Streptomyces sp. NPDC007084]